MKTPTTHTRALTALLLLATACAPTSTPGPEDTQGGIAAPEIPGFELLAVERIASGGRWNDVPIYRHTATALEFVLVPEGRFVMGAVDGEPDRYGHAAPRREVHVRSLLLARTELTNDQFRAWKSDYTSGRILGIELDSPELPAGNIRWRDAVDWCEAHGLRLPSEAEWEYACRAGSATLRFWGDGVAGASRFANIADRALATGAPEFSLHASSVRGWSTADLDDGFVGPAPPASYAPNGFGLFDMLGNVKEHCADAWHRNYADAPADGRAWNEGGTASRVHRGGDWSTTSRLVRCAARGVSLSENGTAGLRPALSLPRGGRGDDGR